MATRTLDGTGAKPVTKDPKSDFYQAIEVWNDGAALMNELRTDHATFKTAVDAANVWCTEVDADLDEINDYLSYLGERDGVIGGDFTITAGAAATLTGAGHIRYRIGGQEYYIDLDTTITLVDTTVVTGSNWKAWRIVIDRLGVVTTEAVTGSAGQSAEQAALLHLGSVARAANTVEIGYFTIQAATGFTPQTDNVNGEANANFRLLRSPRPDNGLFAALGSSLVADAAAATFSVGTIDPKVRGVRLAQISAISNQAMTDADTIADGEAGGWLVVVDMAGTAVLTISSDGVPGVSALTDTDAAGANTALDTLADRLPALFVPVGRITVVNASGGGFTAGTTNWDAAGVTTAVTDAAFATHDRTQSAAAFLGRQIDAPAVPATVTAPVPAAGPATLAAAAVDDFTFKTIGTP